MRAQLVCVHRFAHPALCPSELCIGVSIFIVSLFSAREQANSVSSGDMYSQHVASLKMMLESSDIKFSKVRCTRVHVNVFMRV